MSTEFNIEQFDAIYPEGIENHYWTFARNKILNRILKKYEPKSVILEVGCGRGIVVNYLYKQGYNITGIELAKVSISQDLCKIVKSGMNVFDLSDEESKNVNIIMLLDVIEHIEFPEDFLIQLKDKFKNLKHFIITVPACQELFSNYDDFNGHFRRYDFSTLKKEFNAFEFTTLKMNYFFHSLYLPARILLKTKGKREEKIAAPKGFFKKAIHFFLANIFYLEFLVLPKKLKGTSLLLEIDLK